MKNEAKKKKQDAQISLQTRFGDIQIDPEKKIYFHNGILGLEDFKNFALAHFPNENFKEFKILQSLDQETLAFIVLPVNNSPEFKYANLICDETIKNCAKDLKANKDKIAILFITTVERSENALKPVVSVNLKAPIIINTENYNAIQYVFNDSKIDTKHVINLK